MSTAQAMKMTGLMVDFYDPRVGKESAVQLVARKVRMTKWPLYRLLKGQVKEISSDTFDRIKTAYLDHCATQIAYLQHEIELARADDNLEDLADEIAALAAKVKQRKEAAKA